MIDTLKELIIILTESQKSWVLTEVKIAIFTSDDKFYTNRTPLDGAITSLITTATTLKSIDAVSKEGEQSIRVLLLTVMKLKEHLKTLRSEDQNVRLALSPTLELIQLDENTLDSQLEQEGCVSFWLLSPQGSQDHYEDKRSQFQRMGSP